MHLTRPTSDLIVPSTITPPSRSNFPTNTLLFLFRSYRCIFPPHIESPSWKPRRILPPRRSPSRPRGRTLPHRRRKVCPWKSKSIGNVVLRLLTSMVFRRPVRGEGKRYGCEARWPACCSRRFETSCAPASTWAAEQRHARLLLQRQRPRVSQPRAESV